MTRKIIKDDFEYLVHREMLSSGKDYETCANKINQFIHEEHFGGFIVDNKGYILYSIENKNNTYEWPTVYHLIDESYYDDSGQMLAIYDLQVETVERRKGIALQLKYALEKEAFQLGISTIYSHTTYDNQAIIQLNQKLNYDIVRIGTIWDDTLRVSMVKDLRRLTPLAILRHAESNKCIITSDELKERIQENSIDVLDIRYLEDQGNEIKDRTSCHWFDVYKLIEDNQLNKKRPLAVVCYTGQSSMHVAVLLNLLGYEAYSLLDGMSKYND